MTSVFQVDEGERMPKNVFEQMCSNTKNIIKQGADNKQVCYDHRMHKIGDLSERISRLRQCELCLY